MSFLVWRLIMGWLPVDEVLCKRGIPIASRCVCCAQSKTLHHVFFSNPVASQIWSYFARLAGIKSEPLLTVQQALITWSLTVKEKGHIRQVLPVVILWALWDARNNKKHNNYTYTFECICQKITKVLSTLARPTMGHPKFWKGEQILAMHFAAAGQGVV
ncbi:hypothetical protein LIER_44108 [Lithospermum erythrorhizon]|uniref:Reverse transcriptase zinc-binding domain-containing protein n=1 Tax=Lithospermum erythrorhizon TaxID=34254 RepID=A0AAV3PP06_LITER